MSSLTYTGYIISMGARGAQSKEFKSFMQKCKQHEVLATWIILVILHLVILLHSLIVHEMSKSCYNVATRFPFTQRKNPIWFSREKKIFNFRKCFCSYSELLSPVHISRHTVYCKLKNCRNGRYIYINLK